METDWPAVLGVLGGALFWAVVVLVLWDLGLVYQDLGLWPASLAGWRVVEGASVGVGA
jgi:hypothetical protein